jgi:diguanylate cyclase (GGDEF)-like protein
VLLLVIFFGGLTLLLAISLAINSSRLKQIKKNFSDTETLLLKQVEKENALSAELDALKKSSMYSLLKDPLTELPSRQLFEDRLLQTIHQSQRYHLTFAVMYLDLDGFKLINDALGHDVGDELLKQVAIRLQTSIRQVDSIGRFGGDEFVFVLPQLTKAESAAYVAQRFLDVISQPFIVREQELFITASIGIAAYPSDGEDIQTLLKNADNAVHQAKLRGRNTYQFYREEMHALSRRELILNSSLRGASIYNDFSLFYQKQFNVESNSVVALDVLLHWHHPDFGLISLQEFLRLAENSGKILVIGEWMLRTALQQLQKWKTQKLPFDRVAITVSLRQLENPHFAYKISQLLQEFNLDSTCLILKISEDVLLAKFDLIEKALYMLKHLGVQIAIDEFGTGHLALQQLKRFPIDYIKLGSMLVKDVTVNKESEAIVKMIMALAKSLNITVIAEGVDSEKQKQLLNQLDCHIMQGHLFGDPCRAMELAADTAPLG